METFVLAVLNGLSMGAVLFLVASGLSLVIGLAGIFNIAHGALYMIGAYIGWTIAIEYGLNFWVAILGAGLIVGLLGLIMERGFFRYLHNMFDEQVMLAVGFIYILTNLSLWVWGPIPKGAFTAGVLSGSFPIVGWTYPIARIALIFFGLALAIGLWWLQDKTRVGAILRAGMDDKEMTEGLGKNLGVVTTALFVVGAFIAGATGVIGAQIFAVNLGLSWDIVLLALVVIIVGGTGSVQGALLGGIIIGLIVSFGKALFPDLAMFFIYLAMIIILLIKPSGLLGRKV